MWVPKSETEIVQAVDSNSLEESAIFDGKGSIPTKSSEIAKDIAAMCNDGGIILYGISEDENGRLTKISPFLLEGQKERISSIVQTSISEPPVVFIKSIPSESNPTIGYILIEVPPSDRAPHMVVIKGENRFYGRTAGGNIPLNEGDVSRLYERRKRAEIDIALILEEQIKNAPIKPNPKFGYCFSAFRPVHMDSLLVDKAISPEKPIFGLLFDLIGEAIEVDPLQGSYYPHFSVHNSGRWEYIPNGFRAKLIYPENISGEDAPGDMLVFELEKGGSGRLFCGRAAENKNGNLTLFSDCIIGNFVNSLFLLGQIYKRAGYIGSLDIGIAITGIKGCILYSQDRYMILNAPSYDRESYTSSKRLSAKLLFEQSSILSIADELLSPLFITLTQNRFDVFEKAKRKIGDKIEHGC